MELKADLLTTQRLAEELARGPQMADHYDQQVIQYWQPGVNSAFVLTRCVDPESDCDDWRTVAVDLLSQGYAVRFVSPDIPQAVESEDDEPSERELALRDSVRRYKAECRRLRAELIAERELKASAARAKPRARWVIQPCWPYSGRHYQVWQGDTCLLETDSRIEALNVCDNVNNADASASSLSSDNPDTPRKAY